MLGKKLHILLRELNHSQIKSLTYRCSLSQDKRMTILKELISNSFKKNTNLIEYIEAKIEAYWPDSSYEEKQVKLRRIIHYFTNLLEEVIIADFLDKNAMNRNFILAQALSSNNEIQLSESYLNEAQKLAIKSGNKLFELEAIASKIELKSHTQDDLELKQMLQLNEQYLKLLDTTSKLQIAEYYYAASTIYLEKTDLIAENKIGLIEGILNELAIKNDTPENKALLHASLAKLEYENGLFESHIQDAYNSIQAQIQDFQYIELEHKLDFLSLRVDFFSGKSLEYLLNSSLEKMNKMEEGSILYKNIFFYHLLFLCINNEMEKAKDMFHASPKIYKGNDRIYIQFLEGIYYYQIKNHRKAITFFNQVMYSSNYFFASFARLFLIKIHNQKENIQLSKSYIQSTQKFFDKHNKNPLAKANNWYVFNFLKNEIAERKKELQLEQELSVLHKILCDFQ